MAILLLSTVLVEAQDTPYQLSNFSTDECSMFPEGISKKDSKLWSDCCIEHDVYYWLGGSKEQRKYADEKLQQCVQSKGEITLTLISYGMKLGVRFGGNPWFNTSYRWGYGWRTVHTKQKRNYFELSESDIKGAIEKIEQSQLISEDLKYKTIETLYRY